MGVNIVGGSSWSRARFLIHKKSIGSTHKHIICIPGQCCDFEKHLCAPFSFVRFVNIMPTWWFTHSEMLNQDAIGSSSYRFRKQKSSVNSAPDYDTLRRRHFATGNIFTLPTYTRYIRMHLLPTRRRVNRKHYNMQFKSIFFAKVRPPI